MVAQCLVQDVYIVREFKKKMRERRKKKKAHLHGIPKKTKSGSET